MKALLKSCPSAGSVQVLSTSYRRWNQGVRDEWRWRLRSLTARVFWGTQGFVLLPNRVEVFAC